MLPALLTMHYTSDPFESDAKWPFLNEIVQKNMRLFAHLTHEICFNSIKTSYIDQSLLVVINPKITFIFKKTFIHQCLRRVRGKYNFLDKIRNSGHSVTREIIGNNKYSLFICKSARFDNLTVCNTYYIVLLSFLAMVGFLRRKAINT